MAGQKCVAILLDDLYNEFEFWYPYYRLLEAGVEVVVVASEGGKTYTSKIGLPAKSDVAVDKVGADDFSGVIIPGGYSPDHMRRNPAMVALVKNTFVMRKPVAAICHAGWMLASAGILKGMRATCYHSIKDDIVNAGAIFEDAEVVVDANLITSRSPADLPAFMKAFLHALDR